MSVTSLTSRLGTLVAVTETGPEDVYGNPTEEETTTTVRYELQQQQRSETGAWQVGVWNLFLPVGTSVVGVDQFFDDQDAEYAFVGPPWTVHNPRTGAKSHIQATVRSVT